jgi:hypothetical protein
VSIEGVDNCLYKAISIVEIVKRKTKDNENIILQQKTDIFKRSSGVGITMILTKPSNNNTKQKTSQ